MAHQLGHGQRAVLVRREAEPKLLELRAQLHLGELRRLAVKVPHVQRHRLLGDELLLAQRVEVSRQRVEDVREQVLGGVEEANAAAAAAAKAGRSDAH